MNRPLGRFVSFPVSFVRLVPAVPVAWKHRRANSKSATSSPASAGRGGGFCRQDFRIPTRNGQHTLYGLEVTNEDKNKDDDTHDAAAAAAAAADNSHHDDQDATAKTMSNVILLVVHGGPGLSDHTESLAGLSEALSQCVWDDGFVGTVFFYDQLGCGQSDQPTANDDDTSAFINHYYSLAAYVDELGQVIDFLSNHYGSHRPICILGHSWGGQILLQYLFNHCRHKIDKIIGAIISNAPLKEQTYQQKQRALREALDEDVRAFYEAEEKAQAMDGSVGSMIYGKLIGESECHIEGELKDWDMLCRLPDLLLLPSVPPCLFVSGTEDTVPFEEYQQLQQQQERHNMNTATNKLKHTVVVLEGGDHGPFFGNITDSYFNAIASFLKVCTATYH